MTRRAFALFAALLLVAAALPTGAMAQPPDLYAADGDTDLTSDAAIAEYEQSGAVNGSVGSLNMTVTVAEDAGDVGLNDWARISTGRTYLRINYDENIPRRIRFHLPTDLIRPQLKDDLAPVEGNGTVDLEPAKNRTVTAVTVTVDGPADAVFAVSESRGAFAGVRSRVGDLVGNVTGFDLPSLTSGDAAWRHVPDRALAGDNVTYRLPTNDTDPTIQYDAASNRTDSQWVPVQTCDGREAEVCLFRKEGSDAAVILSTTSDPPPIRWRTGSSVTGIAGSTINDIQNAVDRLLADLGGLFGGGG
jgi:hypothetical protein